MTFALRRALPGALAALLLLAACEDAPMAPTSYVKHAAGGVWVAVTEPVSLPRTDTWLPYVGAEDAAALRVTREQAVRLRAAGRVEDALELEDEMMRTAARSLARMPQPAALLASAAALDEWADRARARLQTGSYPELSAAVLEVAAQAEAARSRMAAGDTGRAVVHLTRGAIAARGHAPLAVGLRLMGAVETRLAAGVGQTAGVRRARHLLADAREGLATGDSLRALRRAVYALQLLDAEGITVGPVRRVPVDSLPQVQ
ncbi:hypothetical protein [Longimicrobium sp.]|uniref:hypothetical protein n=1 Tax=Longimicrobium sp. TaxID=2029185 RepID=UPI003B3B800D